MGGQTMGKVGLYFAVVVITFVAFLLEASQGGKVL